MKKLILLLLVLSVRGEAQTVFPPAGSTWSYYWQAHNGGYNGPKTLFYTGDTVIASVTYKKIASAWNYTIVGPSPPDIGSYYYNYIHVSGDSVFLASPPSQPMQLLYAFNQPAGDSIVFNAGSMQYKIVLDSLRTRFICNQNRRVLYYTKYQNGCTDSVRIVEGIGPVNDYLFSQMIGACVLGPGSYSFTCADITSCIYPGGSCAKVALGLMSWAEPGWSVKVHRQGDEIAFWFSDCTSGEIHLLDPLGKILSAQRLERAKSAVISAQGLPAGIYLVQVNCDKGQLSRRIVVQ
jgi:hypothetical protein